MLPAKETITLTNGDSQFSAYRFSSQDPNAPIVLCLHGFPANADSFRHQVADFLAAGFQVITPFMRGYETSSIPDNGDFRIETIAVDVEAWLDQLNIEKVHLVGHDWGATVTYAAACRMPHRLLSISTIAVPHPTRLMSIGLRKNPIQLLKSWYALFNLIPWLSNVVATCKKYAYFKFLWRRWSPSYTLSDNEWHELSNTFQQAGVSDAMLAYYRQNSSLGHLLGWKTTLINSMEEVPVPNLAITGVEDGCIDTKSFVHSILASDHPKGHRIERIKGAGHFCHLEKPELVNPLLIEWFKENADRPER